MIANDENDEFNKFDEFDEFDEMKMWKYEKKLFYDVFHFYLKHIHFHLFTSNEYFLRVHTNQFYKFLILFDWKINFKKFITSHAFYEIVDVCVIHLLSSTMNL